MQYFILFHETFLGYFRSWKSVGELDNKMKDNKKFILVDEDGSESQISSFISTKLLARINKKHFQACFKCRKVFCRRLLFNSHKQQCRDNHPASPAPPIVLPPPSSRSQQTRSSRLVDCLSCEKQFISEGTLKVHILLKHCSSIKNIQKQKHQFNCEICSTTFLENLDSLIESFRMYNKISCRNCKSVSASDKGEVIRKELLVLPLKNDKISKKPISVEINKANALQIYERKINSLFELKSVESLLSQNVCDICGLMYKNLKSLLSHQKRFHSLYSLLVHPTNLLCVSCPNYICRFWKTVNRHLYDEHCPSIESELGSRRFQTLAKSNAPAPSELFKCSNCPATFLSSVENAEHKDWHFNTEPLKCQVCGSIYIGQKKLNMHMHYHKRKQSGPALCPRCGVLCNSAQDLTVHINKDHQLKMGKKLCQDCGKLLSIKNYKHHRETFHSGRERPEPSIQCHDCGKIYKDERALYQHYRRSHQPHLHVQCDKCTQTFAFGSLLRRHQPKCRGRKLAQAKSRCNQCFKSFYSENRLRRHKESHQGTAERRFVCQYCQAPFKRKEARTAHERIHTGERHEDIHTRAKDNSELQTE